MIPTNIITRNEIKYINHFFQLILFFFTMLTLNGASSMCHSRVYMCHSSSYMTQFVV